MNRYNFNDHQIKELQKLYPNIRIPFNEHFDYYIDLQLESDPDIQKILGDLIYISFTHKNITEYKMSLMKDILNYFEEKKLNDQLNELKFDDHLFRGKECNNYEEHKFYLSVDIKQANFTVVKPFLGLSADLQWYDFLKMKFDVPDFIANSKSFRQLVLGNTNPKRIGKLQEKIILKVVKELEPLKMEIKAANSDEVVYELPSDPNIPALSTFCFDHEEYRIQAIKFMVVPNNFGDFVKIKVKAKWAVKPEDVKTELYGVPGNRYFIHYKTLILNKQIDHRDLLFALDKKIAKWII